MKSMWKFLLCLVSVVSGIACGTTNWAPPEQSQTLANYVVIQQSFDDAWSHAIPQIGKSFFVINNIDKSSGILNISYSGDPEQYVDCGTVHVEYGTQKVDFPGAKADTAYTGPSGGILPASVHRKVGLDGRMNIVFEKITATSTRVTVNARYIVAVHIVKQVGQYPPQTGEFSAQFNTGGEASFLGGGTCRPNGKFEQTVLELMRQG
jgi:hypothetical protein